MSRTRTRHLSGRALLAVSVLAPVLGIAAAGSAAADAPRVADIARSQIGNNCTPYYGCAYPRAWCAEFSRWVWKQAGANTTGLNAAAASFYSYGSKNGTLHTSGPQVGDAVLWDDDGSVSGEANHVSLVVGVSSDGTKIQTVGGNESGKVSFKDWFNWRTYTNPGAGRALAFVSPTGIPDTAPPAPKPPAEPKEWRAQVAVEAGGNVFHAVRNADRTWTDFGNVENVAGEVPSGVRSIAEAGVNGDTHVLAVSNDGRLYHTIRFADREWAGFGDVHTEAGELTGVTQVTAVSIGSDLHVAVVAGGTAYHTIRHADGTWDKFGTLGQPGGSPVTKVAVGRTGDELQVVALSDTGVLRHAIRHADRTWTAWGDASAAAGAGAAGISRIDDVAVAGTGNGDLQFVVTANGGTQQFHGARYGSGTWTGFNSLAGIVPSTTVTDVAAAAIEGELQVAMVTADGRVLHTIRHTNATWSGTGTVDLTGVSGTRTGIAITGTYN
ncbi:CHAP domain-containing protein [Streptomyces antimicrobicus]|uniref:CHAP domain-containing protein n=1 Tax=Streptomyces antimicrobicus TaxID=2883108 RepID=A0ABS8B122_9ACTN|nr:CHAP domain-containing protein [Streptomyces antimicrobicus]MCB5178294.1 CHAP domain-containing protein [Streptomyces antimicrobicus]